MIVKLQGRVRDYDWGRSDSSCLVSQFSSPTQFKPQKYAQLWMGSHPSAPSLINTQPLDLYLKQHNLEQLNYLFKILSIEKCLSIQTHPNKQQAEQLHKKFPALYPDANDKPEMFLTLTEFKAFMGFIKEERLKGLLEQEPFRDVKGKTIKEVLEEILALPKDQSLKKLQYLIQHRSQFKQRSQLLLTLQTQFPNDLGILVSMLLQYRQLKPGQCYYIKPGQPHAYIHGECLELMRNSDNVVRLGLTPKQKDVETLLRILDYNKREIERLERKNGRYVGGGLVLNEIEGKGKVRVDGAAGVGIVLEGEFVVGGVGVKEKDIVLVHPGEYEIEGKGRFYLAESK